MQLGLLGLIAREGDFDGLTGEATAFEYWSLSRNKEDGFGYVSDPVKRSNQQKGLEPEDFLPEHLRHLKDAIRRFIKGRDPFLAKENPDYPGYTDYDQLMRLEEWQIRLADIEEAGQ